MCYETDLTDSQWEIIAEVLEDGRKRQHSLQTIVNAIFYVTKTGVQWRNLPRDFPKWQLVYYYFRKWSNSGLIGKLHRILHQRVRVKQGREVSPSLGLLDSQSVKTVSLTEVKGVDANKKINGRKRFVVTDTLGWIMGLMVVAASVQERDGAEKLFVLMNGKYPRLEKVVADQGFSGEDYTARIGELFGFVLEIVKKVLGVSGFQVLPKRWIVERTFGWLMFNRRLVKDYKEKTEHSEAFIQMAMIRLMIRKLAPLKI
ncbi:MAG: IS5 family transposase [Pyrinomonadaceae bacterium]